MIRLQHWGKALLLAVGIYGIGLLASLTPWAASVEMVHARPLTMPVQIAYLPPGNPVTDGQALLRQALPIDNEPIRKIQANLEGISEWLRGKRWSPIKRDITKADRVLNRSQDEILADIPSEHQSEAEQLLDQLKIGIATLREAVEARDKEQTWIERGELLDQVGRLEELMVREFPFEVPEEYGHLPYLKGRATIEFETNKGTMAAIVDGYSAPLTAGNFVDLVNRGFYDGLEFVRAEDNYVLQTGDPPGPEDGFIDPETGEYRAIPLEILVAEEEEPIYGDTLEALGRYLDEPVLPFSAYGTMGMARPGNDPNGGSSQFFFLLFDPELTPAGRNLLDGRYAVFGYVVENKDLLEKLGQGDRIESARVVSGLDNLVQPEA